MKGEPFMANPEFRNNLDENEVLKSSWNATKNVAFDSGSDGNWLVLDASQQEASIAADIIVFDGSGVLSLDVHLQQTQPDAELQILRDKQPIATIRFDAIGTHHHEIKMSGLLNGMSNFEFKVAKAVIPVRLGRFHFRSVD
ncbi:MAG: hypothetical protein U0930_16435 [Pirellulales bacterium]